MIEATILNYLNEKLSVDVYMERPEKDEGEYVVLEKTSGGKSNHIYQSTFAVQSFGNTLLGAAELNEEVKSAMDDLITLPEISRSQLNSDYNYTDTSKKRYRYQAVYDITHY